MVWKGRVEIEQPLRALEEKTLTTDKEKEVSHVTAVTVDEESGALSSDARPVHLLNAILVAFTL